jgi:hypothetical protein
VIEEKKIDEDCVWFRESGRKWREVHHLEISSLFLGSDRLQ